MFPQSFVIKKNARNALKNNWIKAIMVSLSLIAITIFSEYFCGAVSNLLDTNYYFSFFNPKIALDVKAIADVAVTLLRILLSAVLVAPAVLGTIRFFWSLTEDGEAEVGTLFYFFSSRKLLFRAIKAYFSFLWRFLLVIIICFLPYNIVNLFTSVDFYNALGFTAPSWLVSVSTANQVLFFIGLVVSSLIIFIFFMAPVLTSVCTGMKMKDVFKNSLLLARGRYAHFLSLVISFAGWLALSLLAFPVVYTMPLFLASYTCFAREVITFSNDMAVI